MWEFILKFLFLKQLMQTDIPTCKNSFNFIETISQSMSLDPAVGEKWRLSYIRLWGKRLREKRTKSDGVLSSAKTRVSCFEQGLKCFVRHLAWGCKKIQKPWSATKHRRFWLLTKAMLMRRIRRCNAATITAGGHRHTGALNNGDKMKICKKHQIFEAFG